VGSIDETHLAFPNQLRVGRGNNFEDAAGAVAGVNGWGRAQSWWRNSRCVLSVVRTPFPRAMSSPVSTCSPFWYMLVVLQRHGDGHTSKVRRNGGDAQGDEEGKFPQIGQVHPRRRRGPPPPDRRCFLHCRQSRGLKRNGHRGETTGVFVPSSITVESRLRTPGGRCGDPSK